MAKAAAAGSLRLDKAEAIDAESTATMTVFPASKDSQISFCTLGGREGGENRRGLQDATIPSELSQATALGLSSDTRATEPGQSTGQTWGRWPSRHPP